MMRHVVLLVGLLQITAWNVVVSKEQKVMLSSSYLPVAMQVIAHLTDQMQYETKDEPTTKPPRPGRPTSTRPTIRPPTHFTNKPTSNSWSVSYTTQKPSFTTASGIEHTTVLHKPGFVAPTPPKPGDRTLNKHHYVLLPIDNSAEYTVLKPNLDKNEEALLSPETQSEVRPLIDSKPMEEHLLPPEYFDEMHPQIHDLDAISRSSEEGTDLELSDDELNENNLQYLSPDLRDMLVMAHDINDERAFDINTDDRAISDPVNRKIKLTQTNLRMLLLYDLLSREAKRLKLSDFSGFSPIVLKDLVESSSGGARQQLSHALSKMLSRKDCHHEYANNRAKEMIADLAKDESLMSSELRYLQPLVYKL